MSNNGVTIFELAKSKRVERICQICVGVSMNCTVQTRILRFVLMLQPAFLYNRTLLSLCRLSDEGGGGGSVSVY